MNIYKHELRAPYTPFHTFPNIIIGVTVSQLRRSVHDI